MFMLPTLFACATLMSSPTAVALRIPNRIQNVEEPDDETVWNLEGYDLNIKRDDPVCGGYSNLTQCPGTLSQFCCSTGSQCLPLNTTTSVSAVLCCAAGEDCQQMSPITCDQSAQNATLSPGSEVHSNPTIPLQPCDNACCPPGFACNNGNCYAQSTTSSAASSSSASSSTSLASGSSSASTSSATSASEATESPIQVQPTHGSTSAGFSGKSFAAGFVPGIALGALVVAGVFLCCMRKQRRNARTHLDEKHQSNGRDTLTELGPADGRRPTVHGRSISEPKADGIMNHRTDFSHASPLRQAGTGAAHNKDEGNVSTTDVDRPTHDFMPSVKALFSHSPFLDQTRSPVPTQSPVPKHLKRGTLSYQISPVRALRKQRSMHSLRRHLTDATSRSNSSRRNKANLSRTASTETIKVLMQTPDYPNSNPYTLPYLDSSTYQHPPDSASSWESDDTTPIDTEPTVAQSTYASSSRYPTEVFTPTRLGGGENAGITLGTPYTPTKYPPVPTAKASSGAGAANDRLGVDRDPLKRVTTFSSMMERAGLRRSDYLGSGEGLKAGTRV